MQYQPHTPEDEAAMLAAVRATSVEDLFASIPAAARAGPLELPPGLSEPELEEQMRRLGSKNVPLREFVSFLGAGKYDHYVPAVVDELAARGEFLTAYTPYQAEASQGNLQAFFEYQTMIAELTAMEVANASHYDGGTALAEAAAMAVDETSRKKVVLSALVHPGMLDVARTLLRPRGLEIVTVGHEDGRTSLKALDSLVDRETACVAVQNPNFFGCVEDLAGIASIAGKAGAIAAASCDPISLGILRPPGEAGFDIATGDGQPLGTEILYGGPTFGFMAAKGGLIRRMPGRIVGETSDHEGRRGFVLTLQAREQHIRRAKAASNICTNQAMIALRAAMYLVAVGKTGLREVANLCLLKAHYLASRLGSRRLFRSPFYREFVARIPEARSLARDRILAGVDLEPLFPDMEGCVLVAVTERTTREAMDRLAAALS